MSGLTANTLLLNAVASAVFICVSVALMQLQVAVKPRGPRRFSFFAALTFKEIAEWSILCDVSCSVHIPDGMVLTIAPLLAAGGIVGWVRAKVSGHQGMSM